MHFTFEHIVESILVFSCLVIVFYLLRFNYFNRLTNKLLILILFVLSTHMALNIFYDLDLYQSINLTPIIGFLYFPLFYFYFNSLIYSKYKVGLVSLLHFIPFLVSIVFVISLDINVALNILRYLIIIQEMVYLVYIIFKLTYFRRIIKNTRVNHSEINLKWLSNFFLIIVIVTILDIITNYLFQSNITFTNSVFFIEIFTIVISIIYLVYYSLRHTKMFDGLNSNDLQIDIDIKSKYKNDLIPENELDLNYELLLNLIETKQLYLNPDLNIERLSRNVGLSARLISQTINRKAQTNFSDFINNYRVKYAIFCLQNKKYSKHTISEIMYLSGFNSASTFFNCFKKATGLTPKDFRKTIEHELGYSNSDIKN